MTPVLIGKCSNDAFSKTRYFKAGSDFIIMQQIKRT